MVKSRRATERKLALFLMNEPERAAVMTVEELAEASDVSIASVSRMIRASGFSGFAELRRQLAECAETLPDRSIPVADAAAAMNTVSALVKSSIESCRSMMTAELLDSCAEILSGCTEVYIIGAGTSSVTAQYIYTKLFRLKIHCSFSSDAIMMKMKCALMSRGSVVIAVSSSGRTKCIVESAQIASENGAKVIALTDYRISPLTKCADLLLSTTNRQSPDDPGAELPLIQGQLTVVDMVYALLSTRIGQESVEQTRMIMKSDQHL
ncbi:MAG: MurR/RpiR family transcriptional regulator [Eubacteriales bacterium]